MLDLGPTRPKINTQRYSSAPFPTSTYSRVLTPENTTILQVSITAHILSSDP